jgi:DNA repair exonuclease SbcCD ATPase subunit
MNPTQMANIQYEKDITKLKEENKKQLEGWAKDNSEFNKLIDELKEENKEVRLQLYGVNNNQSDNGMILKPPTRDDYRYEIAELKEELEDFDRYKESDTLMTLQLEIDEEKIKDLKKEITQLKRRNTKTDIIQKQKDLTEKLSNENQEMFDEIEGLKKENDRITKIIEDHLPSNWEQNNPEALALLKELENS